jgi:hypothetical protein
MHEPYTTAQKTTLVGEYASFDTHTEPHQLERRI